MIRKISFTLVAGALLVAMLVFFSEVDNSLTDEDVATANKIMAETSYSMNIFKPSTFEEEINFIVSVQDGVLKTAPLDEGVPMFESREPKDMAERGLGLCYDRSRAIEKILRLAGFETRHVAVYALKGLPAFIAVLIPRIQSHALSEVKTSKGWMLVDSNVRWIGLTEDRLPIGLENISINAGVEWSKLSGGNINNIFKDGFISVIGLYSRHGMFYPPFTPVPDLVFSEFIQNF